MVPFDTAGALDSDRVIGAGATYETRFDVSFQRRQISPFPCTFAVDATLDRGERGTSSSDTNLVLRACSTEVVSPNSLLLTLFTALGALIGVGIRASLDRDLWPFSPGVSWADSDVLPLVVAAVLLSVVLFNVYEYVDVTRRIQAAPSWRSALFIGALSGLFSEQIVEALKAFVGVE